MTNDQKEAVIARIKKHIHQEENGYCAVFWAMKEVMGKQYSPPPHHIQSVASKITESGKYKLGYFNPEEILKTTIILNPESNFLTRNPVATEIIRFVLTVAGALAVYHLTN